MQVECIDEAPGTARVHALSLPLSSPVISARALITARVELEVERLEDEDAAAAVGWLVRPDRIEVLLNGERGVYGPGRTAPVRRFDPQALVAVALDGFQRGSFCLFVDDRQVTSLDEQVALRETSEVVFLKLIPLRSG